MDYISPIAVFLAVATNKNIATAARSMGMTEKDTILGANVGL